ncbi:hypothetical protein F4780DRAFT_422664 [Xylariomycetidae sp. FL0641]|nr:hypothetical protein F4780DRAFT_422664 [Xylariomycetidae sp. FL0641]
MTLSPSLAPTLGLLSRLTLSTSVRPPSLARSSGVDPAGRDATRAPDRSPAVCQLFACLPACLPALCVCDLQYYLPTPRILSHLILSGRIVSSIPISFPFRPMLGACSGEVAGVTYDNDSEQSSQLDGIIFIHSHFISNTLSLAPTKCRPTRRSVIYPSPQSAPTPPVQSQWDRRGAITRCSGPRHRSFSASYGSARVARMCVCVCAAWIVGATSRTGLWKLRDMCGVGGEVRVRNPYPCPVHKRYASLMRPRHGAKGGDRRVGGRSGSGGLFAAIHPASPSIHLIHVCARACVCVCVGW